MNRKDAIYFAGLMEDFLHIPSFVCEMIENKLIEEKYEEIIKYIIQRKREIENEVKEGNDE